MNQKNLVSIIILCIGLGIGFAADRALESGTISDQATQIQKMQSQIEQAKKFFPLPPKHLYVISGVVTDISGDIVTLETDISYPFEDFPKVRKVKIVDHTLFFRVEQKDPVSYLKERFEFNKKAIEAGGKADSQPGASGLFIQSPSSRAAIKRGLSITVTAGEDVKQKESFDAQEIRIAVPSTILPSASQ